MVSVAFADVCFLVFDANPKVVIAQRSSEPCGHDPPLRPHRSPLALYLKGHLTSMSRPCLTALPPETILHICSLLRKRYVCERTPRRQPFLASLARTCAYLSKPALDVLWETVGSLVPLMAYTLPEDLCTVVPVTTEYILRERGVTYQASGGKCATESI